MISGQSFAFFNLAKLVLEIFAIFGAVIMFWLHPSIKMARCTIGGRFVSHAVLLLFFALALAQLTTRHQYQYPQKYEPFPFTRWAMFAGFTTSKLSCWVYDWRGITATGAALPINPAHLYVTPNATTLFTKTHCLGDQILCEVGQPAARVKHALDAFSQGLLMRYNVLNPKEQIIKVELWRRSWLLQRGAEIPPLFSEPGSKLVYIYSKP